jgi:hypothetical protein
MLLPSLQRGSPRRGVKSEIKGLLGNATKGIALLSFKPAKAPVSPSALSLFPSLSPSPSLFNIPVPEALAKFVKLSEPNKFASNETN